MASPHEAYVDAAARLLDLPIAAAEREQVLRYFALAASMAERVMSQPLAPADESGNVFMPVAPVRED